MRSLRKDTLSRQQKGMQAGETNISLRGVKDVAAAVFGA